MKNNISAYLQIYNDHEFLKDSLESVRDFVDEVIVVDGCYSWLANYYQSIGFNPARSSDAVYHALSDAGLPYKVISGVWDNQIIKRTAGYEACSSKYVMRLDSDEVININAIELEKFFSSNASVCGMSMPTYLSDNLIVSDVKDSYPVQNFIYDSNRIGATDHLEYMWLVLTKDVIGGKYSSEYVYPDPVAFNMHLTSMRSLFTSRGRASYYITNWIRKHGFPYIKELNYVPTNDADFFSNFFKLISPSDFYELLVTDKVAVGLHEVSELSKLGLTEHVLDVKYFQRYLKSFAEFYKDRSSFVFISGKEVVFDVSLDETRGLFFKKGILKCESDCSLRNVLVEFNGFNSVGEYFSIPLTVQLSGNLFIVDEPSLTHISSLDIVRAYIKIELFTGDEGLHKLIIQ